MGWFRNIAIAVVVVVSVGLGAGYAASEAMIRRHHDAPYPAIVADRSPAGVAEGGRIGKIFFCQGCHGNNGEGEALEEVPGVQDVAPGFASVAASHSDGEIARAIRYGVGKDGHQMFVMPVQLLGKISDRDIARIIGWIRTIRPTPRDMTHGGVIWSMQARYQLLTGALEGKARTAVTAPAERPADAGAYFANASCHQCHDFHQPRALGPQVAPPLAQVAASYDPAAFQRLLRTGIGMTPRDLGWMAYAAKGHLRYLTDAEIAQVQDYLKREEAAHPTS